MASTFARVVLLAILQWYVDAAAIAAWPVCMAWCLEVSIPVVCPGCIVAGAATGGAACLPCAAMIGACSTGCICFHEDTTVETSAGPRDIADVKAGDSVATAGGRGNATYATRVLSNSWVPGDFEFVRVTFQEVESVLKVTASHPVLVLDMTGDAKAIEARAVTGGSMMRVFDGKTRAMRTVSVANVTPVKDSGKFALETESCTVLASGILTKTLCSRTAMVDQVV